MNPWNSYRMPGMGPCKRNQGVTNCLLETNVFFFCKGLYLKNLEMHYIGACLENTQITTSLHVMLRKEIADNAASACSSDNLTLFINYVLYANSEAEGKNCGD